MWILKEMKLFGLEEKYVTCYLLLFSFPFSTLQNCLWNSSFYRFHDSWSHEFKLQQHLINSGPAVKVYWIEKKGILRPQHFYESQNSRKILKIWFTALPHGLSDKLSTGFLVFCSFSSQPSQAPFFPSPPSQYPESMLLVHHPICSLTVYSQSYSLESYLCELHTKANLFGRLLVTRHLERTVTDLRRASQWLTCLLNWRNLDPGLKWSFWEPNAPQQ